MHTAAGVQLQHPLVQLAGSSAKHRQRLQLERKVARSSAGAIPSISAPPAPPT